ncbi:MAG: hypothetical protein IKP88_12470 [Lachnospiraceae bacterium]|nr:hypothetical protein [Lachnospiraceae bacterium]
MLSNNIFSIIDSKIEQAGSDDPREVAEYFGIMVIDLFGTIAGYATHYSFLPVIGLNKKLEGIWYMFGGWHELAHIFDGHIYEKSFSKGHCDGILFSQDVDSRTISRHEKIANLISANTVVSDEDVLKLSGYDSQIMRSYRDMKAQKKELTRAFEQLRLSTDSPVIKVRLQELKKQLEKIAASISELEYDIVSSNCCRTFSETASLLGIPERILNYKLEAMHMRGLDIDRHELEHYDKMFSGDVFRSCI